MLCKVKYIYIYKAIFMFNYILEKLGKKNKGEEKVGRRKEHGLFSGFGLFLFSCPVTVGGSMDCF